MGVQCVSFQRQTQLLQVLGVDDFSRIGQHQGVQVIFWGDKHVYHSLFYHGLI